MVVLSLCAGLRAARYQLRSAPTRCNSPGRVQSEFPFQVWSSDLRPLFHLSLKRILPQAAEKEHVSSSFLATKR